MKSIMLSVQPQWVEKILNGKKTIEVRKTAPKETPFKVYVYCTKAKFRSAGVFFTYSDNELYRLPDGEIKCGDSAELMSYQIGKYSRDNFLNGKVVAEFICKYIEKRSVKALKRSFSNYNSFCQMAGCQPFQYEEINRYIANKEFIYALHITDLKVYDKPRELGEFYRIKQCKPEYSPFGYQWTWEDRHKRNTGGRKNAYRPVPIECHRCKSLVGGKDYLDEKSGCILFDYECISNHHKPLARPPQSYMRIQDTKEAQDDRS